MKNLNEISWDVSEETYRNDTALSYSTLAKYERCGFNGLNTLFDKVSSPSLTFGSAVDAIITGGMEEFNDRFIVQDIKITQGGIDVCNAIYDKHKDYYKSFTDVPKDEVSMLAKEAGFWKDDKWDKRRYDEVLKTGDIDLYYSTLVNDTKTLISSKMYDDVINAVTALKSSDSTENYFAANTPFDNIQRYYQLKFKTTLNGISYRCMADLICVDYANKTIQPIDLKTSSHKEWDFYKSFVDWGYSIQARLYYRIIKDICEKDDYFKDFTILPYKFIVVNKETLTPLVWDFEDTYKYGTLLYGKDCNIKMRDPEEIADELQYYLNEIPKVPLNINIMLSNSLSTFLNKM